MRNVYGDPCADPQPILPAGYEYLRKHGYEAVDGRGFTEEDIITDIRDCDAPIVRTARITRQIFDAAPKLKILARHGAGYDGVDLAAAREHGVLVCTAGGANAISVAERPSSTCSTVPGTSKKVQNLYLQDYRQAKMGVPKTELEGKTLGLVGLGNIGKLVAQKAALGFDMTVLAYDPLPRAPACLIIFGWWRTGTRYSSVATTSPLHVPATTETVHSVSDREFGLMKPTAYLINAARGASWTRQPCTGHFKRKKSPGQAWTCWSRSPSTRLTPGGHGQRAHRSPYRRCHQGGLLAAPPWPVPRLSTISSPAALQNLWCPSCVT